MTASFSWKEMKTKNSNEQNFHFFNKKFQLDANLCTRHSIWQLNEQANRRKKRKDKIAIIWPHTNN